MKAFQLVAGACALQLTTVYAAPSFVQDSNQIAFGSTFQSATLKWAQKAADSVSQTLGLKSAKDSFDGLLKSSLDGDEDKSVWDIINQEDEFKQLAHVLNYSSDSTKELLSSKHNKLTFFAPINWHHDHHDDDHVASGFESFHDHSFGAASVQQWKQIQNQIVKFENEFSAVSEDDDAKKRKRAFIRHVIDAEALYHLVRSDEPLSAKALADNSSVATLLNTGKDHPYNDATDWRIRTGKSLLPLPGIYLNFYSRVINPGLKASNGLIHAIKYPLILPPDVLQSLFFGQGTFSTSTSALQKVHAAKYLSYHPFHHHHEGHHGDHGKHSNSSCTFDGVNAETIFVPTNLAWSRLPYLFKAYLFSPWGHHLLQKIFMLHSLPSDIVYADWVHHVKRGKSHGLVGPREFTTSGNGNKTSYTFDSVLPSLNGDKGKFEKVDVDVWRYYLLPGEKGPRQTRLVVQNVSVILQDIPASNGVYHAIDKFIKPKGHPAKGLWAEIASEAKASGFGTVDLHQEAIADLW